MSSYKTVPDIKGLKEKIYIWVAYSTAYPYLPIQIAENSIDLAKKLHISSATIRACWSRYKSGKRKTSPYHKVKCGYDVEWEFDE